MSNLGEDIAQRPGPAPKRLNPGNTTQKTSKTRYHATVAQSSPTGFPYPHTNTPPETVRNTDKVVSWKSKDLQTEILTTPTTTDNSSPLSIKWNENSNACLIFKGSCFKKKTKKTGTFSILNLIYFFYCL